MKKRISVILLALVMCFAAVGCNNTPSDETGEEYRLVAAGTDIECIIGQTPDWSKGLMFMLGEQVFPFDNANVVAANVVGGNLPSEVGRCKYQVTYAYLGKEYKQVVWVRYTQEQQKPPVDPDDELHESNMTEAQREVLETAFNRTYKSFLFNMDVDYGFAKFIKTENFAVRREESEDVSKLIREEKHNTKRVYTVTTPDIHDDKVELTDEWYLKRTQESKGGEVTDDMISVYLPLSEDSESETAATEGEGTEQNPAYKWVTRTVEYSEFTANTSVYESFYPASFAMSDREVKLDWFDAAEGRDRVYNVHSDYLLKVASAIFGVMSDEFPQKIELTVSPNGDVTDMLYEYEERDSSSVQSITINAKWENLVLQDSPAAPKVDLPPAEEYTMPPPKDYTDDMKPSSGEAISDEDELAKLNSAFDKKYSDVTYKSEQNLQSINTYTEGKTVGNKRYNSEKQCVDNLGNETLIKTNGMFAEINASGSTVYQLSGNQGDYLKYESTAGADKFDFFIQPMDMKLNAKWFAKKGESKTEYVITKSALPALKTNILEIFSGVDKFIKCEPETFTVTLDEQGNLTAWYMLFEYQETKNSIPSYWKFKYEYSSIGKTSIVLPAGNNGTLDDLTAAQKNTLNAFDTSEVYRNVTVTDTATDITATFNGDRSVRTYYEDFIGYPIEITSDYQKTQNGDKYVRIDYNYKEGEYEETELDATGTGSYAYFMPYFDFTALKDVIDKMGYDSAAGAFVLSVNDTFTLENMRAFIEKFAYYIYDKNYVYDAVVIELTADKKISNIRVAVKTVQDGSEILSTVSAQFDKYGTTVVKYAYEKDAESVTAKIDALPTVINADNYEKAKKAIEAARAQLDDLAEKSKPLVSGDTVKKLTDAEAALKSYEACLQQAA